MEETGFIVHPMIGYIFGSGFPKASDVGKMVDKMAGAERKVIGKYKAPDGNDRNSKSNNSGYCYQKDGRDFEKDLTMPATDKAKQWDGYKYGLQALKPAIEPIGVFQKPWDGSQLENILENGTGAYNVDGSRVIGDWKRSTHTIGDIRGGNYKTYKGNIDLGKGQECNEGGRFPANLIIDKKSVKLMDKQSGELKSGDLLEHHNRSGRGLQGTDTFKMRDRTGEKEFKGDRGKASRFFQHCNYSKEDFDSFFYTSKPSNQERNVGCDGMEKKIKIFNGRSNKSSQDMKDIEKRFTTTPKENNHPTLKPMSIMLYLLKMFVSPIEKFKVIDPFMGSGTTGMASVIFDNVEFYGIEKEKEYFKIAEARIRWAKENKWELLRNFDDEKNKIDFDNVDNTEEQLEMLDMLE